ncbi:MAG: glycoside hydrolase family 9 protein, partial [Planctomycetes bacterium]|nr:glycoside hydrolase family 9 protein [Planctomycetota bacterium]
DYRLEGWLRAPDGEARLGVRLLDGEGRAAGSVEAPRLERTADWRHVAVEWSSGSAREALVSFWVQGRAELDDASVGPVAATFIGNPGVEADARGRIGFWNEEAKDGLFAGSRAGSHRLDAEVKRGGKTSLLVEPQGGWYAVASVNYPVPAWTDSLRLSGWTQAEAGASAQVLALWADDVGSVLRVDASPPVEGGEWQLASLAPPAPPDGALTVRLAAAARGGRAWFDDFDLVRLRPREPRVRVFANQVAYEASGPKTAVVATSFFPSRRAAVAFQLLGPAGEVAWEGEVPSSGRIHGGTPDDWGWYFWRADFSAFDRPGTYRAAAACEGTRGESHPFAVGRGALLEATARAAVDFFFVQRCGFDVPQWHKACHLDDARLPDGSRIDATGGWHSAGDYNKPMWQFGDGAAVYALAAAQAARGGVFGKLDRDGDALPDALDEAWWGARFLARMQDPADGSLRGDVLQGPGRDWMRWTAPDVHTDNVPGTADDPVIAPGKANSPLSIAGWALLERLLGERRIESDCLARGRRLWESCASQAGAETNPLLLIGALELHRSTGDPRFEAFLEAGAGRLVADALGTGRLGGETGGHGDVAAAALALFALARPADPLRPRIDEVLGRYLDYSLARTRNPFGLSRQGAEEGEARFLHPTVGLGVNFWILSRAWAALVIHRLTGDRRALVYAADQVDWVLGKNPLDLCMLEGEGSFNPPRYHHRYNAIPGRERGAVPGAIPNGMVADMGLADRPGFDLSRGGSRSPSFRPNEPWLVHNVFYLLVASELAEP